MTRLQKGFSIGPLIFSLLGWGSTFYLDSQKIKADALVTIAHEKIMFDLAMAASRRCK